MTLVLTLICNANVIAQPQFDVGNQEGDLGTRISMWTENSLLRRSLVEMILANGNVHDICFVAVFVHVDF